MNHISHSLKPLLFEYLPDEYYFYQVENQDESILLTSKTLEVLKLAVAAFRTQFYVRFVLERGMVIVWNRYVSWWHNSRFHDFVKKYTLLNSKIYFNIIFFHNNFVLVIMSKEIIFIIKYFIKSINYNLIFIR